MEAKQAALEAELQELKLKLSTSTSGVGSGSGGATGFLPAHLDPASKRAAFVGWPETVSAKARLEQLEALVKNHFAEFKPVTYVNLWKGPYNDRKLGPVSFVEFGDKDTVKDFVKAVADSGLEVESAGKKLSVKPARTQKNSARNWALRKAEEVLKATSGTEGVKVDWKERAVQANGEEAFKQGRDDLGTFTSNFSHLALP